MGRKRTTTDEQKKEQNRIRCRRWKERHGQRAKDLVRNRAFIKLGWNLESYKIAFEEQGGVCGICGRRVEGKNLDSDHKHTEPPKPRGLLCNACNQLLGNAKDSVSILEAAVEYLK